MTVAALPIPRVIDVEPDPDFPDRKWVRVLCTRCERVHSHDLKTWESYAERAAHCSLRLGQEPAVYAIDLGGQR